MNSIHVARGRNKGRAAVKRVMNREKFLDKLKNINLPKRDLLPGVSLKN
jgi:hypothetical protein